MVWFDHLNGMQITEKNIEAMSERLKSEVIYIFDIEGTATKHILVSTNRGDLMLNIGDWISYDRFGRLRIMRMHEAGLDELRPITNADDNTAISKER